MKISSVYSLPTMSSLSLWVAWNDAIDSGERPLEDDKGVQFLALPDCIGNTMPTVMRVEHTDDGWEIGLLHAAEVLTLYRKPGKTDLYALRPAKKPYRLEERNHL